VVGAVVAAIVAAAAGSAALGFLLGRARPPTSDAFPAPMAPSPADPPRLDRRRFLRGVAGVAAAAVVSGAAGRILAERALAAVGPSTVLLPTAAEPRPAVPTGAALDVEGISPLFTPNEEFYRIDTALTIPRIDPAEWRLRLTGMVQQEVVLSYDDILAMPMIEADITIACVSNEVGGPLVGNARWLGVPLADVLDLAGPQLAATQVVGRSVDGFTAGFRTTFARDGRDALLAVGMNGEPLPARHGFPARLVVPGLYGYISATKWLSEIELTTWEGFDGYWVPRGWDKQARVLLQSRFDTPSTASTRPRGPVELAGVAWEPEKGISRVEVAVDDGPWEEAELGTEVAPSAWRHWSYVWQADEPGHHTLRVRAYDGDGRAQSNTRFPPRPFGAMGHHEIRVTIEG
jgi:DMSO/TMAO reductase YedYZ molybdopterin-dependent catalytic subunit